MTLYKITNKINNKCYIGQTSGSLQRRFNAHCSFRSLCVKLRNAINAYGRDNFVIEAIITTTCQDTLDKAEKSLILELDTVATGYNIKSGGKGVHNKPKASLNRKSAFKGKTHTPEARLLMSKAKRGKPSNSPTKFKSGTSISKKPVIDILTGVIRQSVLEAALAHNMHPASLSNRLRGQTKNKTSLRYAEASR